MDISEIIIESIFQIFTNLQSISWFFGLILLILIFKIVRAIYKVYKIKKSGIKEVDKMSGQDFEIFLENLFKKQGYKVNSVGSVSGDFGADLIIEKDGLKTVVQAKRHKNYVNLDAVREAYSAINYYHCHKSMVVTNSWYSKAAKDLARSNHVELWDRNQLMDIMLQIRKC